MNRAQLSLQPPKHGRWWTRLTLISKWLLLPSHVASHPGSLVHQGRGRGQNRGYARELILRDGSLDLPIYHRIFPTIITQHLHLGLPLQPFPTLRTTRCQTWTVSSEVPEMIFTWSNRTSVVIVAYRETGTLTTISIHPRYPTIPLTEGVILAPEGAQERTITNIVALLLFGEMTKPTVGQVIAILDCNFSFVRWSFLSMVSSISQISLVLVYLCNHVRMV